jgi:hypothetical protein
MTPGRIHLNVADARALAEGALRGIGYDADEARIIADHVIDAALCGYEYSGLAKILNIAESEHFRLPRRPMKVLRETDATMSGCCHSFTQRRPRSRRPPRTGLRWFR